jgi:GNAT superfamily N-acetyltransferase
VTILVRPAREADVPDMSAVMTASVTELCGADHHDDTANIAQWVSNRTPDGVARMMADPAQKFFVAEREGELAAVGAINAKGVVIFNYVSPRHRFCGISHAMISHLEQVLRDRGHADGRLVSTTTAHRFYLDRGWTDDGQPKIDGFSTSYPMRKRL